MCSILDSDLKLGVPSEDLRKKKLDAREHHKREDGWKNSRPMKAF